MDIILDDIKYLHLEQTFETNADVSTRFYRPFMERGSSVVECRTRNQVSPGSIPALLPCRRLGIFVLSIDAPVDSAVQMSTWV